MTHTERARMNEEKGEVGGMGWEGKEKQRAGNSLVVQWLGLDAFFAGAWAWSLVRELRSHKLCDVAKVKKKERKEKGRQAKRSQEEQGGSQGGEIFLCGMTHLGNWERYCSPRNFLCCMLEDLPLSLQRSHLGGAVICKINFEHLNFLPRMI